MANNSINRLKTSICQLHESANDIKQPVFTSICQLNQLANNYSNKPTTLICRLYQMTNNLSKAQNCPFITICKLYQMTNNQIFDSVISIKRPIITSIRPIKSICQLYKVITNHIYSSVISNDQIDQSGNYFDQSITSITQVSPFTQRMKCPE